MRRFTKKDESGTWKLERVEWSTLSDLLPKNVWEFLYWALWKLKDYEDTGLMQSEVETFSVMCDLTDENSVCKRMVSKVANLTAEVDAMIYASDWKLASKQLPAEHQTVLATIRTPYRDVFMYGLAFRSDGKWVMSTDSGNEPLPEGYRVILWRDDLEENGDGND